MLAVASCRGLVDIYDAVLGAAVCNLPPVSTENFRSFICTASQIESTNRREIIIFFCAE